MACTTSRSRRPVWRPSAPGATPFARPSSGAWRRPPLPRSQRPADPPMATARAWCRVDLAGGTLDIWPLGLLHPAAVTVNVAIDVAVEVTLEPARDRYRVRQGEERIDAGSPRELAAQPEGALVG